MVGQPYILPAVCLLLALKGWRARRLYVSYHEVLGENEIVYIPITKYKREAKNIEF